MPVRTTATATKPRSRSGSSTTRSRGCSSKELPGDVEKLTRATGVPINEADYARMESIDSCVDSLTAVE